jgi:biopolymer transport protein ExbD
MTKPQINVTPLIDVLLVLLIIFMVITPIKPSAFKTRVPSEPKDDRGVTPPPLALVVIVGHDLSLTLNHEVLNAGVHDPGKLIERLSEVFAARERNFVYAASTVADTSPDIERTVFIKAPKNLPYGDVAKVVDAVKISGASPISLQIDALD